MPITYASRVLTQPEQKYTVIEKELLAIVYAVQHFRPYVYGKKFTLVTDRKPLVWLNNTNHNSSRLFRWKIKLSEYEYEILYKAGKNNVNADALSRNPVSSAKSCKPILPIKSNLDEIVKETDTQPLELSREDKPQNTISEKEPSEASCKIITTQAQVHSSPLDENSDEDELPPLRYEPDHNSDDTEKDDVFLLKEPKRGKLGNQYTGPHKIAEVLPNNNIKLTINGKPRVVHHNKLRLSHIPSHSKEPLK